MVAYPSGVNVYTPKISDQALVRKFVALNGMGYIGLTIWNGQDPVDPDPGTLTLQVWFNDTTLEYPISDDPRGVQVINITADQINKVDVGKYDYAIGPQYTGNRGVLTAQWTYQVNGVELTFSDYLQILDQMPLYETLTDTEKSLVEQVSWMLGDLFDSTTGGPHLIDEFQTHFDYERIAQLAQIATTRFNYIGFPVTTYAFGGSASGAGQFNGLLVIGTYLEVVRHLVRSYVEIPTWQQMNVTYEDRSQYMARWKSVLDSELPEYQQMVKMAKRQLLQLGRGALLLSGGYFGSGGGRGLFMFSPMNAWLRGFRFYPAAPALSFASTFTTRAN